jgi:hypothetical protein
MVLLAEYIFFIADHQGAAALSHGIGEGLHLVEISTPWGVL